MQQTVPQLQEVQESDEGENDNKRNSSKTVRIVITARRIARTVASSRSELL